MGASGWDYLVPYRPEVAEALSDVPRWSGRYVIIYRDEAPDQIAFWGVSGD